MKRFEFPRKREELEGEESDELVRLAVGTDCPDAESMSVEKVSSIAEEVVYALNESDAFQVNVQESFDSLYMAIRSFGKLPALVRFKLCDALCFNVKVLSTDIAKLCSASMDRSSDHVRQHRNSVQMYIFFMHWVCELAEAEAEQQQRETAAADQGKKITAKARKAAAAAAAAASAPQWDWPRYRHRLLRAAADAVRVDVTPMFNAPHERKRMVELCMDMGMRAMENGEAMKLEDTKVACFELLCLAGIQYEQLEPLSDRLLTAVRRHEHMPALVAHLSLHVEEKSQSSLMAVALISAICEVDAAAYDEEASVSTSSIKHVAEVIACMSELQPKAMASNMSLLLPYLGCKTHQMRCALIHAITTVLDMFGEEDGPDERKHTKHTKSKEHCLRVLLERVLDKSAFARLNVMKSFAHLCFRRLIPLSHIPELMKRAQGRLGDSSVLVVKEALKLMHGLVEHNPWGPELSYEKLLATLRDQEGNLKAMKPDGDEESDDDDGTGPQWEAGAVPLPSLGEDEAFDGMDVDVAPVVAEQSKEAGAAKGAGESEQPTQSEPMVMPSQTQADRAGQPPQSFDSRTLRCIIACLKSGLEFVRTLSVAIDDMKKLLIMSSNADVVKETISLLTMCKRFNVEGADMGLRAMWPLVFHREEPICAAVVDAMYSLYCRNEGERRPKAHAKALIELVDGATLGELSSLEEIVKHLLAGGCGSGASVSGAGRQYELHKDVVAYILRYLQDAFNACLAANAIGEEAKYNEACSFLRCSMTLLSMIAAHAPKLLRDQTPRLLEILTVSCSVLQDAWVVRYCCTTLKLIAGAFTDVLHGQVDASNREAVVRASQLPKLQTALVRVLITPYLSEENWYSAAEEAIGALYALHAAPFTLLEPVIKHMASAALGGEAIESSDVRSLVRKTASAIKLSRFMFVLSHTAIHQLVLIDRLTRRVRREKLHRDLNPQAEQQKQAAEAAEGASDKDDIAAQIGMGSVAADAKLDSLRERVDAELLRTGSLVGVYGDVVHLACRDRPLRESHAALCASAFLALAKLMAIDATYCEKNTKLVFAALASKIIEPGVRCSLMVAVGDLAFRFPNIVEPYTSHMYEPLSDSNLAVRRTCLGVLSHLILNDMMKVKGHIARIAMCMRDSEVEELSGKARAFFSTLAKKAHRGSSPIYNLLPDIMSHLSREKDIAAEDFHTILHFLLDFIKDAKHQDSLKERLLIRFESVVVDSSKDAATASAAAADAAAASTAVDAAAEGNAGGPQDMDTDDGPAPPNAQAEQSDAGVNQGVGGGGGGGGGASVVTTTPAQVRAEWRSLAACIKSLGYSDKGMRRTMELLRSYKHALGDAEVFDMFKQMATHARKHGDKKGDLRELIATYETKIAEAHEALKDEPPPEEEQEEETGAEAEQQQGGGFEAASSGACSKEGGIEPSGVVPTDAAVEGATFIKMEPVDGSAGNEDQQTACTATAADVADVHVGGREDQGPGGDVMHASAAAATAVPQVKAEPVEEGSTGPTRSSSRAKVKAEPAGEGATGPTQSVSRAKVTVKRTSRRGRSGAVDAEQAAAVQQEDCRQQDTSADTRRDRNRRVQDGPTKAKGPNTPIRVKLEKMSLI